ncbi:MAG: NUDIX domain-containing protein, partial [Candidatus Thermoplasmatota archaeon]|nr:NUDIX domain-containing protein [Candidatus Thermoplasmatota archaeon]
MGSVRCDLGVAAVVTKNYQILLVKESAGRYSGHWGLPKGYVDEGELPRDAALRELREECAVEGEVTGIYAIRENLTDIGPAVFIAYSVSLLPNQIPIA